MVQIQVFICQFTNHLTDARRRGLCAKGQGPTLKNITPVFMTRLEAPEKLLRGLRPITASSHSLGREQKAAPHTISEVSKSSDSARKSPRVWC